MNYSFDNRGASIAFLGESGGVVWLLKKSVLRVSIVREDMIEIDTGNPLQNILFRFRDVTDPQLDSPDALAFTLNSLLST